jgi:hypothetical protein
MSVFTVIAIGMCAYLGEGENGQSLVYIGNIQNGICEPVTFMPDSHGQRVLINGHEYGADVDNNGATLYFDQKVFHFVKESI